MRASDSTPPAPSVADAADDAARVAVPAPFARLRRFPLDGALLLFDRDSGTNVRCEGPETAHLRQHAPRAVQFGITNRCNLACTFCSRDQEAWDEHGDALAFLRPCHPPLPTRELFDVVLTGAASQATLAVLGMLEELRQLDPREARALLDSTPAPVRRRLPRGVAEAMAGRLQGVGARVEVRPSEP